MAIPGFRLRWFQNPAFGALLADLVIVASSASAAGMAILARGGNVWGSEGAVAGLALGGAIAKGYLTWREKSAARSHHGLEGCLETLHSSLRASSEQEDAEAGLRLTIHTPVSVDGSTQLEQVVNYIAGDPKRRKGGGRRFSQHCGIIGDAFRTGEALVAIREHDDQEAYVQELIKKWHYTDEQARALDLRGRSFMAVPLPPAGGEVQAVLYIDSMKPAFFTQNRIELIKNACTGIALFIGRRYTK
jgi:hypothetical protein